MRYPHGMVGWADLSTPDLTAAKSFYSQLFGWVAEDVDTDIGTVYSMQRQDGQLVTGMGPLPPEQQEAGQPPAWTCYVLVGDVDEAAAAVPTAGGAVVVPAFDVMESGRMAVVADPAGAVLGLWQPNEHQGAEVFGKTGAVAWFELMSRDVAAVVPFYEEVFGWRWEQSPMGDVEYMLAHVTKPGPELAPDGAPPAADEPREGPPSPAWAGGTMTAGALAMPADVPEQVPSHWTVYIDVEDCEATVSRAKELGATVVVEPMSTPGVGTFAGLTDPQGAYFSVISEPEQE